MADATPATPSHHRMLGAALVSHLPGARRSPLALEQAPNGLFLLWLAYMGLLAFGALLLWRAGAWHRLVAADPTGLTVIIVLLFIGCSLWAGRRAWALGLQRQQLDGLLARPGLAGPNKEHWSAEYMHGCAQPGADQNTWMQILGERAHGPHEMAWWLNGIQLKLGLLGKVIGFSILAIEIGQIQNFDASQSQELLRSLTTGLGVALLTTMVGLVGNILLGLQLTRLDRYADVLVADAQRHGLARG